MIEVRNLYKRYTDTQSSDQPWVLENITLTFPKGVSVGLIGGNGAGKSTLLRILAGIEAPCRGQIKRNCRMSWPIGLKGGLEKDLTGRQNVQFMARIHGANCPNRMKEIIDFVEDFAEIGEHFNKPVKSYSSGMKSRLAFGLSLAFDFDVYISDEATSVGDRAFKEKATAMFKEKVGKAALIIVSHSEDILRDLCQAGVYLKNGQAHWYDDINQALLAYHIDVDNTQEQLGNQVKQEVVDEVAQIPPEKINIKQQAELSNRIKKAKPPVSFLQAVIRGAKTAGWSKEEISQLSAIKSQFDDKLKNLSSVYNLIPRVRYSQAKNKVNSVNKQLNQLLRLQHQAQIENWPEGQQKVLDKAVRTWQEKKMQAEIRLEELV